MYKTVNNNRLSGLAGATNAWLSYVGYTSPYHSKVKGIYEERGNPSNSTRLTIMLDRREIGNSNLPNLIDPEASNFRNNFDLSTKAKLFRKVAWGNRYMTVRDYVNTLNSYYLNRELLESSEIKGKIASHGIITNSLQENKPYLIDNSSTYRVYPECCKEDFKNRIASMPILERISDGALFLPNLASETTDRGIVDILIDPLGITTPIELTYIQYLCPFNLLEGYDRTYLTIHQFLKIYELHTGKYSTERKDKDGGGTTTSDCGCDCTKIKRQKKLFISKAPTNGSQEITIKRTKKTCTTKAQANKYNFDCNQIDAINQQINNYK